MWEAVVKDEESFAAVFVRHSEKPPVKGIRLVKFVGICDE